MLPACRVGLNKYLVCIARRTERPSKHGTATAEGEEEQDEAGAEATKPYFPERRSRRRTPLSEIPGLADALCTWLEREWDDDNCPHPLPTHVEVMNYLQVTSKRLHIRRGLS